MAFWEYFPLLLPVWTNDLTHRRKWEKCLENDTVKWHPLLVFAFLQNPVSISYIPGNDLTMRRRTVALKPFNSFMTVWGKHILHLVDNVIRDFETLSWLLDFVKNGPRKKGINFRGCKTFTMCSICVDHKKQSQKQKTYKSYPFTQPCNSSSQIPVFLLCPFRKCSLCMKNTFFTECSFKMSMSILSILPRPNNWHST